MLKRFLLIAFMFVGVFALVGCGNQNAETLATALEGISVVSETSEDITLPTSAENDVVISWSSSNTDIIANDGKVTRPDYTVGDTEVTLTVTLTLGDEELTDTFVVTVLATANPIDSITEGHFVYSFFAEGYGAYTSFFTFYEEDPVLGAVFYIGAMNNGSNFAGTYTVEEADFEWSAYPNRASLEDDNIEPNTGTAPFTVSFYDFEGNLLDQAGYDGTYLYNDMEQENLGPYGASEVYYMHDTDSESEYASTYEGEVGIPFVSLVDPDDEAATLALNHNKTYTDLIGDIIVEGTWSVEEGTEGILEFTLTPTESYDVGAVVVLNADKTEATYTADGSSTAINLEVPVENEGPAVVLTAVDDTHKIYFYEDGTYMYTFASLEEFGTWTFVSYQLTLTQNDGTEDIVATMDSESHALEFHYQNLATTQVSADFSIPSADWGPNFGSSGTFTPVVPLVVLSFTGEYVGPVTITITVELYDNDTVVITQAMTGAGTQEIETGTYSVSGSGATTSYDIVVPSGNYSGVLNSSYNGLEFTYTYAIPSALGGGTADVLVESGLPGSE